jgi:hypothetical protein
LSSRSGDHSPPDIASRADAALLARAFVQCEGQAEDVHLGSGRGGILVGVGRQRERKIDRPFPQAVDGRKEVIDIGLYCIVNVSGASEAELAIGIVVIALEEKGARQIQPHPFRIGFIHQDPAVERDGAVIIFLRHRDGGQQKQALAVVRIGGQHAFEQSLGIVKPVVHDQ